MPTVREVFTSGITKIVAQPASQPGDVFPSGVILQFAGSTAPTNWLICDGTAVSRGTYAALFAVIGTTYGAGDGSTTFNLPDLRDKVPVGKSGTKALGSSGGAETHAISIAEMPVHNHGGATGGGTTGTESADHTHSGSVAQDFLINLTGAGTVQSGTAGSFIRNVNTPGFTTGGRSAAHTHTVPALSISSQGSGTAHSIMQPYLAVNHIIKT